MKLGSFAEIEIKDWQDLRGQLDELIPAPMHSMNRFFSGRSLRPISAEHHRWVFRGQPHDWCLQPTLERLEDQGIDADFAEKDSLQTFKRKAGRYVHHVPPSEDNLAWLALMQHYGAPTRLLDWTFSAYVAAYFACRELPESYGVLYCLNLTVLEHARAKWIEEHRAKKPELWDEVSPGAALGSEPLFSRFILPTDGATCQLRGAVRDAGLVFPVEPSIESERLASQQGLLMTSSERAGGFQGFLIRMSERSEGKLIMKLRIPAPSKVDFMRHLDAANIHAMSLFPDMDGLCRMIGETLLISGTRIPSSSRPPKFKPLGRSEC